MPTILPPILGMPPMFEDNESHINEKMMDSMPVATIRPAYPSFLKGMSTMKVDTSKGKNEYNALLRSHGFQLHDENAGVKVAFLADSFPTDSFSNSYTEGFLQQFSNGLSKKASTLIQTVGGRTGFDAAANVTDAFKDITKGMPGGGMMGNAAGVAGKFLRSADKAVQNRSATNNNLANSIMGNANAIAGGSRVDFPQIWSDSQFTPSYTMTIRLYNPDPSSEDTTNIYIIGPIGALMLLGIPISTDGEGSTYNYPFLHDIKCPGIYHLNPCYISNIAVIKGGDQQQIAYNQRMGIVDVRIDFGSLFSSMLASKGDGINESRPNLKSYLSAMRENKTLKYVNPSSDGPGDNGPGDNGPGDTPGPGDNGPVNIPDPSGGGGENRDPDPEITKKMYTDIVKNAGSLKKALAGGSIISKAMGKELFKDGIIDLADLMSSFPDINISELESLIDSLPSTIVSNLNIDQIKTIGKSMLQNILDNALDLNLPKNDIFNLGEGLMDNISKIAGDSNLSITDIISSKLSFIDTMKNSLTNGMAISFDGAKNLFSSIAGIGNKLNIGTDSALSMGTSLLGNLKSNIGGFLSGNQLVHSAGTMLGTISDKLTPDEGFNLLTKLKSSIGDFNLSSGIDLVNKVKSVADGDIFASLDLVDSIKKLSGEFGMDDNNMLSSALGIFDSVKKTVADTGIPDNTIVKGGIELFKSNYNAYGNYDVSLHSTADLLKTATNIASKLNVPGVDVVSSSVSIFDNFTDIKTTLNISDMNILDSSYSILGNIQNISSEMGITNQDTMVTGRNIMGNMSNITSDIDTMMYILDLS